MKEILNDEIIKEIEKNTGLSGRMQNFGKTILHKDYVRNIAEEIMDVINKRSKEYIEKHIDDDMRFVDALYLSTRALTIVSDNVESHRILELFKIKYGEKQPPTNEASDE